MSVLKGCKQEIPLMLCDRKEACLGGSGNTVVYDFFVFLLFLFYDLIVLSFWGASIFNFFL